MARPQFFHQNHKIHFNSKHIVTLKYSYRVFLTIIYKVKGEILVTAVFNTCHPRCHLVIDRFGSVLVSSLCSNKSLCSSISGRRPISFSWHDLSSESPRDVQEVERLEVTNDRRMPFLMRSGPWVEGGVIICVGVGGRRKWQILRDEPLSSETLNQI